MNKMYLKILIKLVLFKKLYIINHIKYKNLKLTNI